MADTPAKHSTISTEEKDFIEQSIGSKPKVTALKKENIHE